jgi:DNA repair protein RecO (recombination protein O)
MLIKDTAICIRVADFSETSQIVTLFTRATGKISAIAKGSKRPKSAFDGPIEIFSYGEIIFSDSSREKLATLTEFQQKASFSCTADNLFALNCCLFGAELVNALTHDYDPHPQLFDSFLQFLQDANEHRKNLSLLILFQLVLLKEIGLMPILNACANCKTKYERRATSDEFYFSSSANGLICRDCEASFPDKIKLTKNAADCLTDSKLLPEANEKTLNEIEKVLVKHFTEILHHPPKMAKYILKR